MDESLSRDQVKVWTAVLAATVYPIIGLYCGLRFSHAFAGLATVFGLPMLLTAVTARLGRISPGSTVSLALASLVATFIILFFMLWLGTGGFD